MEQDFSKILATAGKQSKNLSDSTLSDLLTVLADQLHPGELNEASVRGGGPDLGTKVTLVPPPPLCSGLKNSAMIAYSGNVGGKGGRNG